MVPLAIDIDPYAFACDGALGGIPHFWNVVTNLPFLLVGLWGLWRLHRDRLWGAPAFFNWTGFWISVALVCLGSGAYHWVLLPWGLALDRAAICGLIAFLFAHVLHVGSGVGPSRRLSFGLLLIAEGTVGIWLLGGTAWVYGALQAFGAVATLVIAVRAWRAGRLPTSPRPLFLFVLFYALAKVVEVLDVPICELTGFIGGHPLKHLLAALGLACLLPMMRAEARAAAPRDAG